MMEKVFLLLDDVGDEMGKERFLRGVFRRMGDGTACSVFVCFKRRTDNLLHD